jgi:ribosomal subunit interface protein
MQVLINGRGVVLPVDFKNVVQKKLVKLDRLLPRTARARVSCESEKFRRAARIVLTTRRRTFSSHADGSDLLAAVDVAIEALARQVREDKDRRRSRSARAAGRRKAPIDSEAV